MHISDRSTAITGDSRHRLSRWSLFCKPVAHGRAICLHSTEANYRVVDSSMQETAANIRVTQPGPPERADHDGDHHLT